MEPACLRTAPCELHTPVHVSKQRNTVLTLQHVAARGRLHRTPLFERACLRQLLHRRQHLGRHLLLLRAGKW